ncbi:MAG: LptF/LptG family permease [Bacteroidales bacterium]
MICLFIVLMQFIWAHVKDFIGKGLELKLLAELFFYAAMSMVPLALPLAILLASLMTFGNLGERFELLAIKASGTSLIKIMRPLIVTIVLISIGAFLFQNNILPKAQVKMFTLLYSMRQKSPELDIPEGVFYDKISGYNLYLREKNNKTGMMHDVIIYDISKGFENAMVILADSGKLKFTSDKQFLLFTLYGGESFENLKSQHGETGSVPYRRETFSRKEILIPFDASFNRMDDNVMEDKYIGKDISQLKNSIDSMSVVVDSLGQRIGKELKTNGYYWITERTGIFGQQTTKTSLKNFDLDREYAAAPVQQRENLLNRALARARAVKQEYEFKSYNAEDQKYIIRRHEIEMHKKFTLSFACLIFFFIGAPLGAIIRKGGLGVPIVVSVFLFIFYYIIDNSAQKMAREGLWLVWEGLWLSSAVLLPLGIFFTYKAVNDSAVFNKDAYSNFFRKLLGKHMTRNIAMKEIVMDDISEQETLVRLARLDNICREMQESCGNGRQHFFSFWQKGYDKELLKSVCIEVESFVEYTQNTRSSLVILKLMDYPILRRLLLYKPCSNKKQGTFIALLLPLSIPVYLIGLHEQKQLRYELSVIRKTNAEIKTLIEGTKVIAT